MSPVSTLRAALAIALVVGASACGAKTGLLLPEPGEDAVTVDVVAEIAPEVIEDVIDVADHPLIDAAVDAPPDDAALTCVDGRFRLIHRATEIMFVIDRSGSMEFDLDGNRVEARRWDVLHNALATSLPRFQTQLGMGALAYPRRFDGNQTHSCQNATALDVQPELNNAPRVLSVFESTDPWGGTPTADALSFTGNYLAARVSRTRSAVMVLATDGAPNCNTALDPFTCECTTVDTMGRPNCFARAANCFDDQRAATVLSDLITRGIPTYVIGLDSSARPIERAALDRMARAGGRPNVRPGEPAYYSARRPESLLSAFEAIQRSVVDCTLVAPSRPEDPDNVRVELAGSSIPRDPTHQEGWDWTSLDFGQISFFGAACERVAASPMTAPEVVIACTDGG